MNGRDDIFVDYVQSNINDSFLFLPCLSGVYYCRVAKLIKILLIVSCKYHAMLTSN